MKQGANILIDRKGNCKLADFGSAQNVLKDTEAPKIFGTVCYMAPEVIKIHNRLSCNRASTS